VRGDFLLEVFIGRPGGANGTSGPAPEILRRALVRARRFAGRGGGRFKIVFTGGEPLGDPGPLFRLLRAARRALPSAELEVVSAAELLTPRTVRRLVSAGAEISARFDMRGGRRARAAVPAPLAAALSDGRLAARVHAAAVLDSRSIGRLQEIARLLGARSGFKQLEIALDAGETWTPAALDRLRLALKDLKRSAAAALMSGGAPAGLVFSGFDGAPAEEDPGRALTLLPDGRFYPSDLAAPRPPGRFAAGNAAGGIDACRLRRLAAFQAGLGRKYGAGPVSPAERYALGAARGLSGRGARAFMENAARVNRVFAEEAGPLFFLTGVFARLRREPGFGDLVHPPRYAAMLRMREMAIACDGPALSSLRACADLFLRSPGGNKRLALEGRPGSTAVPLAAYLLAASLLLGKKSALSIVPPAGRSR